MNRSIYLVLLVTMLLAIGGGCPQEGHYQRLIHSDRQDSVLKWQKATQEDQQLPQIAGQLTLQDAIKLALLYNKSLQASCQERQVAKGRILESYGEALPSITLSADYIHQGQAMEFQIPGGGQAISMGQLDNYSVNLQVRQPIFRAGAISAAMRAARLYAYLADEQVRAQVQATIFEVASSYYEALLAQQLYQVQNETLKAAEGHLRDVQAKQAQGMASKFDLLRAQVDVSTFKAEMIQQQNRLHMARSRLLKAMGVSQDAQVELVDQLRYEPLRPVLEKAVEIAMLNRPDLYAAQIGLRMQQEAVRIAKSQYWPQVYAFITQTWARPDPVHLPTRDQWGGRWNIGIQMELPIFNGFRREGRLKQEMANLNRRILELEDAEQRTILEVQQALLNIKDAEELVESQKLNLERAEEGLRLAQAGYREGVTSQVEVVDAHAALTRASGLYYQAIYAHVMARLALQRAMGILGPAAVQKGTPTDQAIEPGHIAQFAVPTDSQ